MTVEQIAVEMERSSLTVKRWLAAEGLRTSGASDPSARARRPKVALETTTRICDRHGETEFVISRDGYFRCKRCRVEALVRRRRKVKEILVAEAGGACRICGYDRYLGALEFHHREPSEKRLSLGMGGLTLAIETLRDEAAKCVLLCSNCHAEVEAGISSVPVK